MSVPERVCEYEFFDRFWEQLSWDRLEKKVRVGLRNPSIPFVSEINCPAVFDLARQIVGGIGESAINRAGESVSPKETFTFDQRLALMRILEAIISEYEDYKKSYFSQGRTPAVFTKFPPFDTR
jgi:hypothetical protein